VLFVVVQPVDRERVHSMFVKFDVDGSGNLDRQEFHQVMMVLCSNVFARVMVQWTLTLMVVPLLAQLFLDKLGSAVEHTIDFVTQEHEVAVAMALGVLQMMWETCKPYWLRLLENCPNVAFTTLETLQTYMDLIPGAVWESLPVTLISCLLGTMAVPYLIFKIDEIFDWIAEKTRKRMTI